MSLGQPADRVAERAQRPAAVAPDVALQRTLDACSPLPSEPVAITDAVGRVLAEPVFAQVQLPRETTSAMDGFAVRAADGAHQAAPILGESRAGEPFAGDLPAGGVIRIATGATLPPGADAVVRIEDARLLDGGRVTLPAAWLGDSIRTAGQDVAAGDQLLPAGTRVTPHHLTGVAAAGNGTLECTRKPVVSLLVTGDEVVAAGQPLAPGQVTDVHGVVLPALVRGAGAEVSEVLHVRDGAGLLDAAIQSLAPCDVVVITGGLSVGEHDHTRGAFDRAGAELFVERLLLRPGQPTAIGASDGQEGGRLWFGLPGNPVSAFVVSALLLVPALRALAGERNPAPTTRRARLVAGRRGDDRRWLALRAVQLGDEVELLDQQDSHMVAALARADALVLLPPRDTPWAAGDEVELYDLGELQGARSVR